VSMVLVEAEVEEVEAEGMTVDVDDIEDMVDV